MKKVLVLLVFGLSMGGCSVTVPGLLTVNYPGVTTPAGVTQSPLDGVWAEVNAYTRTITISGNTGVFTAFGSNALVQDGVSKGYYTIGGQYLRNLTKTGDLTWSGQELALSGSGRNATGAYWKDAAITLSADGQTLQFLGLTYRRQ